MEHLWMFALMMYLFLNGLASPLPSKTYTKQASIKPLQKRQLLILPYREQLQPRTQISKPFQGSCKSRCKVRCTADCDFLCCVEVPGTPLTKISRQVYPVNNCASYCPRRCYPRCTPSCCNGNRFPRPAMTRRLQPLERLTSCPPSCSTICFPQCPPECCIMSWYRHQSPSALCPAPCSGSCYPQCSESCCRQTPYLTEIPRGLHPLQSQSPCPDSCSSFCYPQCPSGCCNSPGGPSQQQLYLPLPRLAVYVQSTPPPPPSMLSNGQCPQACHSSSCYPECSESCCRAPANHPQPMHFHPRILGTCKAPCPSSCYPSCDQNCCAHHVHEPTPPVGLMPLEALPSCPNSCPVSCYPDCSESCCKTSSKYKPYSCPDTCPSFCLPKCEPSCCDRK